MMSLSVCTTGPDGQSSFLSLLLTGWGIKARPALCDSLSFPVRSPVVFNTVFIYSVIARVFARASSGAVFWCPAARVFFLSKRPAYALRPGFLHVPFPPSSHLTLFLLPQLLFFFILFQFVVKLFGTSRFLSSDVLLVLTTLVRPLLM